MKYIIKYLGYYCLFFNYNNVFLTDTRKTLRRQNTGLMVSSGVIPTSWGGVSLALVGQASNDGIMIKMPYGVDVLPALYPIFSY